METQIQSTSNIKKPKKNNWTAVRVSEDNHKKLSFLSAHKKIKLSHMIEILIEREYLANVEEIRNSL